MATHRNAVNPPPLQDISPAATTVLPPAFAENEADTQDDLEVISLDAIEAARPTERTPLPPSTEPNLSEIRTILSPPPFASDLDDEELATPDTDGEECIHENHVASSLPPLHDQQVRLARKS